jgi:hypothetical protein
MMSNTKTTIKYEDITDEMKKKYLVHILLTGKFDPAFRNIWIDFPSHYCVFTDYMSRLKYLKYKDGRAKNGLTISVLGKKWLDKQQGEHHGTNK